MSFMSHLTMITLLLALLLSPNIRADLSHFPAAVPLAVRSPYFTTWNYFQVSTSTNTTPAMAISEPATFNPKWSIGWTVFLRVDSLTYWFLGFDIVTGNGTVPNGVPTAATGGAVNFTNIVITPTQTVVVAQAGPMEVNLTFLNSIEPKDWVNHAVQVYSDVSGEWCSGDRTQEIQWNTTSNSDVIYHSVHVTKQTEVDEILEQATWGTLYYGMRTGINVTYKVGADLVSRGQFAANGTLDDQEDQNFRPIDQNHTVFAISRDLGIIQSTQASVVWAVGYTTDPAVTYTDLSGAPPMSRSPYYKTQYSTDEALIVDFFADFNNASSRAQQLDHEILQNATSVSNLYGDLVSLAIAQVYGSTQLTVGTDASENYNKSDVMMFMKNIGGIQPGPNQIGRINPVEVLYAAFPALMYIDPSLGAPLLEPLFRLQASPNYTIPFAAADLGLDYPRVSYSNLNHDQGVEQFGNMLIMTYAYARASGDGSLTSRYYSLLTSWADYLIKSTLLIYNQSSADGLTVSNQTNLAIKGIIAIETMSKMCSFVNQTSDASKYSSAAANLYGQWKSLALSSDQHLLATYGQANSWTSGYNLFADQWLGTNLVESSVYIGQSNFLDNIMPISNFGNFGIPVDNMDTNVTFSSWSLFVAAMTSNQDLRSQLISMVHNLAFHNISGGVFPVIYLPDGTVLGGYLVGAASPALGAVFAPLALKAPVLNINPNGTTATTATTTSRSSHTKSKTPEIAGGIMGAAAAAILSVIGIIFFVRRRRRQGATLPVDRGTGIERFSPSQEVAPVPPGLSGKEIAQLRARTFGPQPLQNPSALNASQSTSSPNAVNESGRATSTYDPRRLHSEVESLVRREMERLRAEELVTVAPPSYTGGDGQ